MQTNTNKIKNFRILAPSIRKVKEEEDESGEEVTRSVITGFHPACVFDISQTEGEEVPEYVHQLKESDEEKNVNLIRSALLDISPAGNIVFLSEKDMSGANGFYNFPENFIAIKEGMSSTQTIKTMIHETAHSILHRCGGKEEKAGRRTRELQAESIAFIVCRFLGIDSSDYSFGYVAGWAADKDGKQLADNLEIISKTAKNIIDALEELTIRVKLNPDDDPDNTPDDDPESSPEEGSEGAGERKPNAQQIAFDFSFEDAAGVFFEEAAPQEEEPLTTEEKTAGVKFYTINEEAARRAKEANSWNDYKAGSATAEYKEMVRQAAELAQNQKNRVDPMYHDRIDSLLDTYARRLAENLNKQNEIDARVPSVLIAGGSNFPTRKKEKQNAARNRNYEEYKKVESLLDKIRGTGMGGISSDDPQAIEKLREKLSQLENLQATMRSANAYFRKNKTLEGCPVLTDEQIKNYYDSLNNKWNLSDKPFESYELSNNNANIRRIRQRIKELEHKAETTYDGWEFSGGYVEPNTELNRLQIFFDGKPEEETREELKRNGFRWSPKNKAWQRQLNANAYCAAKYIDAIKEN